MSGCLTQLIWGHGNFNERWSQMQWSQKLSSHKYVVAEIELQMDVVMKKLVMNRCGHENFPNKIFGDFLAT